MNESNEPSPARPSTQTGLEEYLDDFIMEYGEAINSIKSGLELLGRNENDRRALEAIYRNAHNMKGGSNALGFPRLGGFFSLMESALEPSRKMGQPFTKESLAAFKSAVSAMESSIDIIKTAKTDASLNLDIAERALKSAREKAAPSEK